MHDVRVPYPEQTVGHLIDQPHSLKVRRLDDDTVLIEGDRPSLTFLGELLIAVANDNEGCSYRFGPRAAGSAHFDPDSEFGLYLHATPCEHGTPRVQ